MPNAPRTLTDAATAVRRHIDNGRASNVDQAAAQASEQHAARVSQSGDSADGATPQQG